MSTVLIQARRAMVRAVTGTKQQQVDCWQGEVADRSYDGGEFSGPAMARDEDRRIRRIMKTVQMRFGVKHAQLYDAYYQG